MLCLQIHRTWEYFTHVRIVHSMRHHHMIKWKCFTCFVLFCFGSDVAFISLVVRLAIIDFWTFPKIRKFSAHDITDYTLYSFIEIRGKNFKIAQIAGIEVIDIFYGGSNKYMNQSLTWTTQSSFWFASVVILP